MKLAQVKHVFSQEVDCCGEDNGIDNLLTVETEDGGGGPYLVISTKRFALDEDSLDQFVDTLRGMINSVKP